MKRNGPTQYRLAAGPETSGPSYASKRLRDVEFALGPAGSPGDVRFAAMSGGRYNQGRASLGDVQMINVTVAAASKISELLAEENKGSAGLRVFVQGGGCSGFQYGLMIDEGEGDATTDSVIESNGVKLLVDPISARYLSGAEVDFVDNITGGGFTIKNPNAKSTCGCGSSFSV
jgi:iron-sulfur cluster insertion protein